MKTATPTMNPSATLEPVMVNGIDTDQLRASIKAIAAKPKLGLTRWSVTTRWMGGTRSDTTVDGFEIGGRKVAKPFTIKIDEPCELCGTHEFPNPQQYLMAAMNACMMVGYVSASAMAGVELESVRIETEGDIDLRGFLGISDEVPAGYDEIRYTVYVKGNGTPEQFRQVHETVSRLSPNRYNIARPIPLKHKMVIE